MGFIPRVRMLAIIAALALASPAAAQDAAVVALPLDWTVGETHKVEMTKEKERLRGGKRQHRGQAVTPVATEVLRKDKDGYVLRWTYGRTRFVGIKMDALGEKLANIVENLKLDLRIDAQGSVAGLENRAEIGRHYKSASDAAIDWMLQQGLPDATINQLGAVLEKMSEPASVEAVAMREPALFFMAFGGAYRAGESYEFEDTIPNPWGQTAFPTKAKIYLQSADPKAGTAAVGWKQAFDRDKAGPALEQTMRALGIPVPKDGNLFTGLSISDDALWIFDTKTGWMMSGSWQRSMTINGTLASVERIKFRNLD